MPRIKKNKQPQPNIKPSEYKKLNKKMKTMVDWNAFGRNSVSKITSPEYENSTYSGSLQQKIKEKEKDLKDLKRQRNHKRSESSGYMYGLNSTFETNPNTEQESVFTKKNKKILGIKN